jgi:hypothetical protein
MTSKYQKGEISATTVWIITYEGEFRVKLERKTQEKNSRGKHKRKTQRKSRVWLCSAQLVLDILLLQLSIYLL